MSAVPKLHPEPRPARKLSKRALIGGVIAAGVLLLVLANVHLVYVAVTTQPDCVAHPAAQGTADGVYQAAKPAC